MSDSTSVYNQGVINDDNLIERLKRVGGFLPAKGRDGVQFRSSVSPPPPLANPWEVFLSPRLGKNEEWETICVGSHLTEPRLESETSNQRSR
jgi:hypothetical protein